MRDSPPTTPPADWYVRLRDSGRSMVWLAGRLGTSRTYLHDVAAGRATASPELLERIAGVLDHRCPRCGFLP